MTGSYANVVYSEREAINAVWILVSTAMIFLMQAGFALLECGSVRAKNSTSILIKNLFDACVGSIAFWLVGYAFAFGDVKQFIGGSPDYFASSGFESMPEDHYLLWIFHFAFASTSATIVSGSLAERTQLNTYIMFSFLQTGFIYPVVAAWTWGGGWLAQRGFHDFAGVTTIHLVGGCAGLCGAAILGERYGKEKDRQARNEIEEGRRPSMHHFDNSHHYEKVIKHVNKDYHLAFKEWLTSQSDEFRPHNQTYVVTGTLILWVAWLFFNGGSTNNLFVPRSNGPAKIIMNTVISGSAGGVVAVFVKARVLGTYNFVNRYDCGALCNGALVGLVSITGCCDQVEPWAAFIIGVIGALVYVAGCKLLDVLHVDDPVEAAQVHCGGGIWGTIATGFFSNQRGLFYDNPDKGTFFGYQILGLFCVIVWVAITSSLFFYAMKRLGLLRIDKAIEIIGLDIAEMGGVSEEMYEKMRREFGGSIYSPRMQSANSPSMLNLNKSSLRQTRQQVEKV